MGTRQGWRIAVVAVSSLLPAVVMATSQPEQSGSAAPEVSYQQGLRLEHRGDVKGAVEAYRFAADSGHGMAQRKLGDIYGTGKDGIERDYETSLRWYWKTQEQGLEVPKPFVYPGVRR